MKKSKMIKLITGIGIIASCVVIACFIGGVHVLRNGLPSEWKGVDYTEEIKVGEKNETYDYKAKEKNDHKMRIGSNVYVKETTYFPTTKQYADEFYKYLHANNKDGISMMLLEGKLFIPDLGEKYAIVNKGWIDTELKSMRTGQTIFVNNDLLEKCFSE